MTEALYCYPFEILCQPLSWWSSAAAWVQAVMSVLAILAAAFVPRWLDAQKRKDSAEQFLVFAKFLLTRAESLHDSASTTAGRMGVAMFGHKAEWRSVADGAMELSLELLPSPEYLPIWLQLREMAIRIADYHEVVLKHGDDREVYWDDEGQIDWYIRRTRELYNELVRTDIAYRGRRGHTEVEAAE